MSTRIAMPPAFRRILGAGAVNAVGDGACQTAVPLLAITVTDDPRLVSMVSAAALLPWLLCSLPFGVVADRNDRVTMMWRSQVVQAVLVAVVAVLAGFGSISILGLAALAAVMGCCDVLFGLCAQSVVPQLVPSELVPRANGRQTAVTTAGSLFVGPPLGSLLFGISVALPFGVDVGSFAISAALLATLPRLPRPAPTRQSMRCSIVEGVRWLGRHRLLRALAITVGVNNFCGQLGNATLVLLATGTLHVSVTGYGLMLTGTAVGAVLGGIVNAGLVSRIGQPAALFTAMIGMATVYAGIGLSSSAVMLGILLALNGLLVTLWNIVTVTLRQRVVPPGLLGRVNSVYRLLGWGLMPLGALAGGQIAAAFGLRAPYLLAGLLRLVMVALVGGALLRGLRSLPTDRGAG